MGPENVFVMMGNPKLALISMTVPILMSLVVSQANAFVDIFWCSSALRWEMMRQPLWVSSVLYTGLSLVSVMVLESEHLNVNSSPLQSLQMFFRYLYSALMTLYGMWWSLMLCELLGGFLMTYGNLWSESEKVGTYSNLVK